jgi:hypothetical protein
LFCGGDGGFAFAGVENRRRDFGGVDGGLSCSSGGRGGGGDLVLDFEPEIGRRADKEAVRLDESRLAVVDTFCASSGSGAVLEVRRPVVLIPIINLAVLLSGNRFCR